MKSQVSASVATLIALVSTAVVDAHEFRVRFVQRIGDTDVPLAGSNGSFVFADPPPNSTIRIRLQFGVFDDASGPAPAGGLIGWNAGSQTAVGGVFTRTPGRLAPFNWCRSVQCNGLPSSDPFTSISGVDATVGAQFISWDCDASGDPAPFPLPVVLGVNSYVSVWEFSIFVDGSGPISTEFFGNLIAASEWRSIGPPIAPDCSDPQTPIPGSVTYVPFPLEPVAFSVVLQTLLSNPCPPDINSDGVVTSQDFFDFLAAFFSHAPLADYNADEVVNAQDFFDFSSAFFAGCP